LRCFQVAECIICIFPAKDINEEESIGITPELIQRIEDARMQAEAAQAAAKAAESEKPARRKLQVSSPIIAEFIQKIVFLCYEDIIPLCFV